MLNEKFRDQSISLVYSNILFFFLGRSGFYFSFHFFILKPDQFSIHQNDLSFYLRTLEAPWHRLEGNIAIDSEGEGLAKSGFFAVPVEAFFEMDVWMR